MKSADYKQKMLRTKHAGILLDALSMEDKQKGSAIDNGTCILQQKNDGDKNTGDNTIEMPLIKKTTEDIPTGVHACSSNNADGVSSTTA